MEVFVYGTLTDPGTAGEVLATFDYRGPATLVGLSRVAGRYPTLAPGGRTEGRLLWTPDAEALDRYEGVDRGLYVRCSVPATGWADREGVECYVGDPTLLDAATTWPGEGPFAERVRRYLSEQDVSVVPAD